MKFSLNTQRKEGKTVALTRSRWLRRTLEKSLSQKRRISFKARARNLGVQQAGAGRRHGTGIQASRFQHLKKRMPKIMNAKRLGGQTWKVAKMGLKPAALYGAKVKVCRRQKSGVAKGDC